MDYSRLKVVAFASFISKALTLLDKHSSKKNGDNSNGSKFKNNKKKKSKGNKSIRKQDKFKYLVPKAREPHKKEVNGKIYYYCDKPYGIDGVPM